MTMKVNKIKLISLVVCLTLIVQDRREVVQDRREEIANPQAIVEVEAKPTQQPIPFSLPTNATVVLKNGGSRSGRVIDINSQDITIKRGESVAREAITNIAQIKFSGNTWWPSIDRLRIRGDEINTTGKPRIFKVRRDRFEWEDIEKGIAKIKPEALIEIDGKEIKRLTDIPRPMWNITESRYVVSKIEFEPERQTWIITGTLMN